MPPFDTTSKAEQADPARIVLLLLDDLSDTGFRSSGRLSTDVPAIRPKRYQSPAHVTAISLLDPQAADPMNGAP
jgi:hypothetical protein